MNSVKQDDLEQDFRLNDDNTAVIETRTIFAGGTSTRLPDYELDKCGLPPSVSFVSTPQAHQINGTKLPKITKDSTKDSRKYNRSIVVVLGSINTAEHRDSGNVFIFYKVWVPHGEDPTAVGEDWLDWNPKDDSFAGKTFREIPLQDGGVTVDSQKDQQVIITYTSSNTQISYTWTGKWHHSSDHSPEFIDWTGGPVPPSDLAH